MAQNPFSRGLQFLTEPKTLGTFLFSGVALGVIGNAVYQLLTNWLTTSNSAVIKILIACLLVLLMGMWFLHRLAQRVSTTPPLANKKPPDKRRGIIFLVSNEATIRKAIDYHGERLEWCRLICTEESLPLAAKLKTELKEQGKDSELALLTDVLDPVECRNKVDEIYRHLPAELSESEVILDFTGMTSIASVGAVLACLDEKRAIQYTPGIFDKELKVKQPLDPVEIVLDWSLLQMPEEAKARREPAV